MSSYSPWQGHPSFRGKPLAVCHSNSAVGTAEVSSANYEARAFGIHAGHCMSRAKQRCPHLLVLPYEVLRNLPSAFLPSASAVALEDPLDMRPSARSMHSCGCSAA